MTTDISLGSLIVPSVFTPYVLEQSVVKNGLLRSGIIGNSPLITARLAGAGAGASILSFANLDTSSTAANNTSTDSSVNATPEVISAHQQKFVRVGRNKVWQQADWDATLLGQDPMAYIGVSVVDAILKWRQTSLIKILSAQAANAIANSSASVLNIAVETVGSPYTSAQVINAANIAAAVVGAWGDMGTRDMLMDGTSGVAIFMHSNTYSFLVKTDPTSFQRASAQTYGFTTYTGFPVIVDDTLPVRNGSTSGHVYQTILIKAGAVNFGYSAPKMATEIHRYPLSGNGGGGEALFQRDNFAFHVTGFSFTGTPAGDSPTDTELGTSTNWTQILSAKQTGVCVLQHNNAS